MEKFRSIISEDANRTSSYKVANLAYIAMIGGVYALTFLGIKNARMLKMTRSDENLLLGLSLLLIAGRLLLFMFYIDEINNSLRLSFSIVRLADLALFFIYYFKLLIPYRLHIILNEEYENMSYRGLSTVVCIASIFIDMCSIWGIAVLMEE